MNDSIGGYVSYETNDHKINTLFFRKSDANKALIRFQFDSLPKQQPISIDSVNHECTDLEKSLIEIRQDALGRISKNEGEFFKFYNKTSLNAIPVITHNERLVYVITGPQIDGVVLIGNDYLFTYNNKNEFKKQEKIHNSLIQLQYRNPKDSARIESTVHSHVISDCIDPTDICTLLLYKDYVGWTQHFVISKKYVSIFDMNKETLLILTREAWDKIGNNKKE